MTMKKITIRKSLDFSSKSKIFVHVGDKLIHIKGFKSFSIPIEKDEEFYASHLWTRSNKISYEQLTDLSFLIKPRMGKVFAFIIMMILIVCMATFILTQFRWSFIPLVPFVIYILLYLSLFRNRYLIIQPDKEDLELEDSNSS